MLKQLLKYEFKATGRTYGGNHKGKLSKIR